MTPKIADLSTTDNFELVVTYKTGETRKFDASQLFKYKIYEPLKNKGFFKLAKFDNMCVYWNDDIDLDPDWLYNDSVPLN